jgi:hypothetical protein
MIADGDTVGVPAEVARDLASAAEGRLGIDDPILPEQRTEKTQKQLGLFQGRVGGTELQFPFAKRPLEAAHELASKHPATDAKEEWLRRRKAELRTTDLRFSVRERLWRLDAWWLLDHCSRAPVIS